MTNHRPRPIRRAVTALRVVLGLVVASTLLGGVTGGAPVAEAQAPAATLGGYTGSAAASGLKVVYNPQGLLPTGAPVDFGAPDALATIASGPSTFARASIADPGDLLANPEALLTNASAAYPGGIIPPYPFRITASSGVGEPTAESNPAPGLNARVQAEGGSSSASATAPALGAPAILSVGSMAAYATTSTDGASVRVNARSEFGGVNILGLVTIESIVIDVTATSTGGDTVLEGGTTVVGASFLGTPAEIDDQGIRALGLDVGAILEQLGVRITLPGPVTLDGTTTGQLASTGLRIDIEASQETLPVLGELLDALPPIEPIVPGAPGVEDILAVARANHLLSVELGRGVVSLTARTPAPRVAPATTPPNPVTPSAPSGGGSSGGGGSAPVARPSTPAAPTNPVVTPAAPVAAPATAPISVAAGITALGILLLIATPFIGDGLARVAVAQLATDQEGCSWERR